MHEERVEVNLQGLVVVGILYGQEWICIHLFR